MSSAATKSPGYANDALLNLLGLAKTRAGQGRSLTSRSECRTEKSPTFSVTRICPELLTYSNNSASLNPLSEGLHLTGYCADCS